MRLAAGLCQDPLWSYSAPSVPLTVIRGGEGGKRKKVLGRVSKGSELKERDDVKG